MYFIFEPWHLDHECLRLKAVFLAINIVTIVNGLLNEVSLLLEQNLKILVSFWPCITIKGTCMCHVITYHPPCCP